MKRGTMKGLASLVVLVGMSVGLARASSVDLTLHTTGDTPIIDLSTILNEWGTPSSTTSAFTVPGSGTNFIAGLNLVNDTGSPISSLAVFAYGTIGSTSYTGSCTNGSGSPFTSCSGPGLVNANTTISINSPISWTYSGVGSIANGTEFRLVDTATGTGTDLFYEIEINGNRSTTAVSPEPSTMLLLTAGLFVVALAAYKRRLRAASSH